MRENGEIIQKNKEFLLAELLMKNQELQDRLDASENSIQKTQKKCDEELRQFTKTKKEFNQLTLKLKDSAKQLILKDKVIDVKSIEIKKLTDELKRVKKRLEETRSEVSDSNLSIERERSLKDEKLNSLELQHRSLKQHIEQQESVLNKLDFENRKYIHAINSGKQGIWDYSFGTDSFELSQSWCLLFGYSQHSLIRDLDSFLLMVHSEDRPSLLRAFSDLKIRKSGSFKLDLRIHHRDSTYLKVEHIGAVFRDQNEKLTISGCTTLLSIDQQENNEDFQLELSMYKEQIEMLQETVGEQKQQIGGLKGQTDLYFNQITDLTKESEDLKRKLELKDRILQEREDEKSLSQEILRERESEIEKIKKELNARQSDLVDSEKLSELSRQLQEARDESANLLLVAEKTDNAIIITDKNGLIEYVNKGFERLTEFTKEEVIGRKPGSFLQGPETSDDHVKAIRFGLKSQKPFSQDIINYSKSGRKYWLSISITPILNEYGQVDKFIAVETDVTESKQRDNELSEAEAELRSIMEDQFVQSEELIQKEKQLSEALAESERVRGEMENLSMVASKTDNAVIITDAQGQILYVNDGFERITEYNKEEVIGRKPGTFLQGPNTNPDHVKAIRDGLNSKKPFKQEILNYSKSGRPYWLSISINPIFDEHGKIEKFIAVESEITEQKQKEEEYANLSLVASKTDNAVIITDRYGMIEWVNRGFERITEYGLEEVRGKKPGAFLQGPETKVEDIRTISQGIKSGKPFKHEIYNYSKSGRGYWLSLSVTPVYGDNGVLQKFIAIESDITKEKEAQAELENLSLVASRTDNAVIITDKYGQIEWVNDGFTRLTEYDIDEVKGKKPGTFLQGEKTSQSDVMTIKRGIKSQKPFKHEIYNYSKSGRGYWLSLSITPIFDENGEISKFIAIESDITKQKEAELELENLSLVASKTDNAVIISDKDGHIEWVNQGFVKITEYTLEEVKGKKPGDFLQGPDTREEDVLAIRRGLKSEKPFTAEIYNYSKSGREYWLSLSITPIFDEFGLVEKFVAIERDITESKKLSQEIEDSEEQMRVLMEDQFANEEQLIKKEEELRQALEESKTLSLVASKTDNAVVITDKDGLIQFVNDGFERITGYSFAEVRGRKPGSFLQGPETNPKDIMAIREGLVSKRPFTQEILNYSKHGKPYWLSLSITPVFDEHGEVEQFVAIESDISERKAAEEEMETLSLVASKTDNAVIITSKDGLIEWVNEGFEKITEYRFDEVVGRKPGTFLQGEGTTQEQVEAIRDGLRSNKPFASEIYNYSKSGRGYWLSLSVTPIFDQEGKLEKFIAIESDISERKELELEIKESEEQMREIMDQQFESSEELLKKEEALNKALEEETQRKKELDEALARLKDTQSQIVQSEKMASLGQLTAGIAHEINNPINFVYNGIDSLNMSIEDLTRIIAKYNDLDGADPREVMGILGEISDMKKRMRFEKLMKNLPSVLSDIKNGANRTIEIVKGLRVFSRLDEEDQKPANINECLDSTLILLRNKTKNHIDVKKYFDDSLGDIMCYPGQLNQVFMNLLSNAVQAIPEERKDGRIMIYTENQEKSVIIRILDNGSGIPDEVKKKIFEPFFTTKPVGVGTGLGLSISYGIIEKHDGQIYVNSEVGKGTEFVIELPKESKKLIKAA